MTQHTDECQLTCEHCRHGSACYKACCWCGAVRNGEGEPQVECTCGASERVFGIDLSSGPDHQVETIVVPKCGGI